MLCAVGPVRDAAAGRLEPDQTAERRGRAHRTAAIGAVADRDHAGGDRRPRASTRAARAAIGCPRIARRSIRRGFGGRVRTELGHVGPPDDHETGTDETVGEPAVRGRAVPGVFGRLQAFVQGLAGDRARRILHDDRHAAKRDALRPYLPRDGLLLVAPCRSVDG